MPLPSPLLRPWSPDQSDGCTVVDTLNRLDGNDMWREFWSCCLKHDQRYHEHHLIEQLKSRYPGKPWREVFRWLHPGVDVPDELSRYDADFELRACMSEVASKIPNPVRRAVAYSLIWSRYAHVRAYGWVLWNRNPA